MIDKFLGYYRYSTSELDDILGNAKIVLDTNFLLDFYRISDDTFNLYFSIINKLSDRIYIPYQIADEYHKNLFQCLSEQYRKFNSTLEYITKLENAIAEKRNQPVFLKEENEKIGEHCKEIRNIINTSRAKFKEDIVQETRKKKITELIKGKIGTEKNYSVSDLQEFDIRLVKKTPPGYKDYQLKKNESGLSKYGDLIIWEDIKAFSKVNNCDILFISSDVKEDWFQRIELPEKGNEKVLFMQPTLVQEFYENNRMYFLMIEPDYLLDKLLKMNITDIHPNEALIKDAKEELREINKTHELDKFEDDSPSFGDANSSDDISSLD